MAERVVGNGSFGVVFQVSPFVMLLLANFKCMFGNSLTIDYEMEGFRIDFDVRESDLNML